jgi:3-phenylpropionate/trans-cinnamate dioxygenase ferredoxin component
MPLLVNRQLWWRSGRSADPPSIADREGLEICSIADLDRHGKIVVRLVDPAIDLLVMKVGGRVYALNSRCPHASAPLDSSGVVVGRTITCATHGRRFDLGSGRCLDRRREQRRPLTTFRAWIEGERVLVALRYQASSA